MAPLQELKEVLTELPRGGYLVQTGSGYIQFGSPPETIKDTMSLPLSVPQVFVLPKNMFSADKGISLAELEFPIYYNFFIRKNKVTIVGTRQQCRRLIRVLREAVFGPTQIDLSREMVTTAENGSETKVVKPDLRAELNYYKTFRFRDLIRFTFFENGEAKVDEVLIRRDENGDFDVFDGGGKLTHVPGLIRYTPRFVIGERLKEPYVPPLFGVTCLGPSHGFDPTANTSGYIVWLNHRGIMVDPPVDSTEWLTDSNVNPKLIDSVILTHCHADHDAGTFQKLLEESRITIYTTETIINSFLRKYASLSDETIDYLRRLFDFQPIRLGKPCYIHGGEFLFNYTLHSIPTIAFTIQFQGKSFVYSSDHQGEPRVHDELLEKGVISQERYNQLQNFPWNSDVIYHESGIPPLHTAVNWLNSLPRKIQKKLVVYHIASKDFPKRTNLKLARFGIENTLYFGARPHPFARTYEILSILKHLDFFQNFPLAKIQEFLLSIQEERFRKGETIIRKGSPGTKFYIVYTGNVAVNIPGLSQEKIYGAFEYFGELSLIANQPVFADVVAQTNVVAYTMERDKFLSFISGTEFEITLKNLVAVRGDESWDLLSTSRIFHRLTSFQKTWLEAVFAPTEADQGQILVRKGQAFNQMYIIRSGEVTVKKSRKVVAVLKKGDFIGNFHDVEKNPPSLCTYVCRSEVSLFSISRENMLSFAEKNPGLIMKLTSDLQFENFQ